MAATILGMPFPPAPALTVSEADRASLEATIRASTSEQRAVTRARIVLRSADGIAIERVAAELGVAIMTVKLWRRRYARLGLPGLADEPRQGRPPVYSRDERDRVIALTLSKPAEGTTHWSVRRLADRLTMSETTVWRIWRSAGLKPHRVETFKWSNDPDLEAKIRDVVGLYLAPPERAIVLSLDEKTQIQALDRTAPMLPMKPGQVERHTHDYKRNGTTHLFAALEVATGKVTAQTRARHTAADFLALSGRRSRGRSRQCQLPQDPGYPRVARSSSSDQLPLHPDVRFLDEPNRDMVRHPEPSGHPAGNISLGQGADRDDHGLHCQLERRVQSLRLGQDRRRDPG
jgi:transposase